MEGEKGERVKGVVLHRPSRLEGGIAQSSRRKTKIGFVNWVIGYYALYLRRREEGIKSPSLVGKYEEEQFGRDRILAEVKKKEQKRNTTWVRWSRFKDV